jgi:hypothetical protein
VVPGLPHHFTQRGNGSADEITNAELREAALSGHPLGRKLVERLEKELGRRLHRGKAGRPKKSAADAALFG